MGASGTIVGTQLQKTLHKLKDGAKVTVTANVDTMDSWTNGGFSEVVGFEKDEPGRILLFLSTFFSR